MFDRQLCKMFGRQEVTLFNVLGVLIFLGSIIGIIAFIIIPAIIENPLECLQIAGILVGFSLFILSDLVVIARCPKNK